MSSRSNAANRRSKEAEAREAADSRKRKKQAAEEEKRKKEERQKALKKKERLMQKTTGKTVTAKLLVDEGWITPVKKSEKDDYWFDRCYKCFAEGTPKEEGQDLTCCDFCRRVYCPKCIPASEVGDQWACPCCISHGKNEYEDALPERTIAMQRALGCSTTMRPMEDFMFCIISKGRASNVPAMHKLFDEGSKRFVDEEDEEDEAPSPKKQKKTKPKRPKVVWVVGEGETAAYRAQGAEEVVEGGGLCASRNKALELAAKRKKICVQLSGKEIFCVGTSCA